MAKRVNIKDGLRIGTKEFSTVQDYLKSKITDFNKTIIATYGISVDVLSGGLLGNSCKVINLTGYNVAVTAGEAVDGNNNNIIIPEDTAAINVPAGDAKLVLLKYATSYLEEGTVALSVDGSESLGYKNTITGTDTTFTESFRIGHYIKIVDSTLGNNGIYQITRIDSDTIIRVSDYQYGSSTPYSFVTESGLTFSAIGSYSTSFPTDGDARLYLYDGYEIIVRNESSGYTEGTELVLARVYRQAGTVVIVDLRQRNILTLKPSTYDSLSTSFKVVKPAWVRVTTGFLSGFSFGSRDGTFVSTGSAASTVGTFGRNNYIKLEWGHKILSTNAVITSLGSSWRITDSSLASSTWSTDYWKDAEHYLVDSNNNEIPIITSGGNSVTVGTLPATGDLWITPNAETYEVVIQAARPDGSTLAYSEESTVSAASSPVRMYYQWLGGVCGQSYILKVCSKRFGMRSDYVTATPSIIIAGNVGAPSVTPIGGLSYGS